MAFNQINVRGMDLPLKIFVKEGNHCEKLPTKKVDDKLGFKGLEAKTAYEETISQNYCSQEVKKDNQEAKKVVRRKRKKEERTDNQISVKNVTVNSIFKAIETRDLTFLKSNLHADNVNLSDGFGWTPLMSAAYAGNLEIVEFLLKLGAKTNIRDKSGFTASTLAMKNKFTNIASLLERSTYRLKNSKESFENPSTSTGKKISNTNDGNKYNENRNFFCDACNSEFKNTTKMEHESSIVHIFNTKPKVPAAHYLIPKGSKGYQMLVNSGWNEEHGLGPSGEGRKYPVKTTLKQDRKGLGLEQKETAKVTHFKPGDRRAVKTKRLFNERTLRRRERESYLKKEARREKALRKALS